jgi:glycosyltransferase involved in cell wall biosynthesis
LKILHIGPVYPFRGGIAHYTVSLSQALGEQHEVRVLSFQRQYPTWLYPGSSDKDPSNDAFSLEAEYTLSPLNPFTWWRTAALIREWQPDVVLIQWWVTFWSFAYAFIGFALRKSNIPLVFLIHDMLQQESRAWDGLLAKATLRWGNAFIIHSEHQERSLLSILPKANTVKCPHPLYYFIDNTKQSKDEARQELGLAKDIPVLLFFGFIRPYKDLSTLIDAVSKLIPDHPDIQLIVAGEFWEKKSDYLRRIDELELSHHIQLIDRYIPNEEVGTYFSAADLFIAPHQGGTQSGALALALGLGIPSIATEQIAEGTEFPEYAPFSPIPAEDPTALAETIKRQLINPSSPVRPSHPSDYGWGSMVEAVMEARQKSKDGTF